jgi:membrane associated rhomboid family serine protease
MIPIRDHNRTARRPVVTYLLIAANVAVFLYQLSLEATVGPEAVDAFIERFGVIAHHLVRGDLALRSQGGTLGSLITPVTYLFLHGGLMHILGNMWFLHVFGDNVEDSLGRGRYIAFYVLCGLAAAFTQVAIDPTSRIPLVGASGAIAGVLAGYVTLYPHARVITLVFLFFIEVPAFVFIFVWFGMQLLNGTAALGSAYSQTGGIAFFAHIGGFVAGLVLIRLFRRKTPKAGERRVYHVRRGQRGFGPGSD